MREARGKYRHSGDSQRIAQVRWDDGTTFTGSLRDCRQEVALSLAPWSGSRTTVVTGRSWVVGNGFAFFLTPDFELEGSKA